MITLAASGVSPALVSLAWVLVAAAVATILLKQVKLNAIPGYLVVGVLLGPSLLGLIKEPQSVKQIGDIAVVLLMFGIGMHMDLSMLKGGLLRPLMAGLVSTIVSVIALSLCGMLIGLNAPAAIAVGIAGAMSSTAVVLRLLQQRRELKQSHGRLSFGILVMQDLLVIAGLAAIPALAAWADGSRAGVNDDDTATLLQVIAKGAIAVGAIGLLLTGGRWALPRLLKAATRGADTELLLITAGGAALGAAALTAWAGFSPELGAFIVGFLLAGTPFRHEVEGQLVPLRDLFLAVFFVSVGLRLDVTSLSDSWHWILISLAVVTVIKAGSIAGASRITGAPAPVAIRSGLGLAQAGEFSLVVLVAAMGAGVIQEDTAMPLIATVVLSLIVTPTLVNLGPIVAQKVTQADGFGETEPKEADGESSDAPRVLLAGFGPVGRAVAHRLELMGCRWTLIDLNPETIERQRKLGRDALYGDVTNRLVLESAGIEQADAVLIAIPDDAAMLMAVRAVRAANPRVKIFVRASVLSKGLLARQAGADDVVVEEVAAAEIMARDVTRLLGDRNGDRTDAAGETPVRDGQ
ncbi:MAG: cation:proton antiporter [Planctomycetota bacterium]